MKKAGQGNAFLGTDKIGPLILKFAIPAIISMVVNALYNMVDQIFIGWGIGELGMAATNVAFPLNTVSTAVALLFGVGGAANFNLSMGAGRQSDASDSAGNALTGAMVAGGLVGVIALIFLRPLLFTFGATEAMMTYAVPYTAITAVGLPFMILTTCSSHLIRADGSPTFSMTMMLAGALFNLIFDPIFLFVFDMGIQGIALATTLGQVLSSALGAFYLLRRFRSAPLTRRHLRPQPAVMGRIAAVGAASCFNQLAMTVVQITQNNTLRHYGGLSVYGSEIPQAAIGAISKLTVIFFSFTLGVAQGCQPITSYNYGAKNYGRVRETYKLALIVASGLSAFSFLCYQLIPNQMMLLFGAKDPLFYEFATRYLRTFMFMAFINGIHPVTSNFFTSIGRARMGLWMSLTRQILLLLPLMLLLPRIWGIDGFMFCGPIADLCAAALTGSFALRELRRLKGLAAAPQPDAPPQTA